MKTGNLYLGKALKIVLFSILFVTASFSQDFNPPKPVESAFLDKWVGEWSGEGEYNGNKQTQYISCKWDLNHQFLLVEVNATGLSEPQMVYNGKGFYTVDREGNVLGYWFDIFGVDGISNSKGKPSSNKLETTVTAPGYISRETAEFINDNEVHMSSKGTYEYNGQKILIQSSAKLKRK